LAHFLIHQVVQGTQIVVTFVGIPPGVVNFINIVTLDTVECRSLMNGLGGHERRIPDRRKAGIPTFQLISCLAAHASLTGGEGDGSARRQCYDEGNGLWFGPFAYAARSDGSSKSQQGLFPSNRDATQA
jgi:hypothetical protein